MSSMALADAATAALRHDSSESTTATMPYWDGCSSGTQARFKKFYAYCQVMATLGCLACANPVWPLLILLVRPPSGLESTTSAHCVWAPPAPLAPIARSPAH